VLYFKDMLLQEKEPNVFGNPMELRAYHAFGQRRLQRT
jgi:hypothetical protein